MGTNTLSMCITHKEYEEQIWMMSLLSSVNQNISVSRVWLFIYETFANTKCMGKVNL